MKSIFRLPLQRLSHSLTRPSLISMQYSYRNFSECRFSEDHEWIMKTESDHIVGITNYAQDSLGEIVFVEFPEIGDEFNKGDVFGQIESVKAASELYMPVAGEITEVNERLNDEPGLVNSSPEQDGWMIKMKVKDEGELENLMDKNQYNEYT
eukprot:862154_1